MKVEHNTYGTRYIDYEVSDKSITFGDDDLSLNIKNRQRDEPVMVDICADHDGYLVVGAGSGWRYVAQIWIPGHTYEEVITGEGEDQQVERIANDFNMDDCVLYLYAMEG